MILDRPARGPREPGPLRSPLNTEEGTETIGKDDWLNRFGDHGRTVIMAVPPTHMRCSGIHQQHDPVDVKSLGDAIHFAATGARERNGSEATAQSRQATGPERRDLMLGP